MINEFENNVIDEYNSFLYDNCHNKKCLIFTNSRGNAEKTIDEMKKEAARRNENDVFYVHHGSISASLRREAEEALRDNDGPTVAAATLTLELGIDIGDLDSTIQIGAPYTCSSFVQRLGRSGRRTGKSQMMFLNLFKPSHKNPLDALPWDLLRSIAIIQLYLEERWVEPFEQKKKPFSLLAHQTLSVLMSYGELMPSELAQKVLLLPVFKNIKINTITTRFGQTFAILLESGMQVFDCMKVMPRIINDKYFEKKFAYAIEEVNNGKRLSRSLENTQLFPPMLSQMVNVGENTGSLDEVLNIVGDYYQNVLAQSIQRATALLEPMSILLLGGVVLVIILAVMLPMFNMVNVKF